jgi:hypothetical protein
MVYGSGTTENSLLDGVDITENFFNESSAEPNVDAIIRKSSPLLGAPAEYGTSPAVLPTSSPPGDEPVARRRELLLQPMG